MFAQNRCQKILNVNPEGQNIRLLSARFLPEAACARERSQYKKNAARNGTASLIYFPILFYPLAASVPSRTLGSAAVRRGNQIHLPTGSARNTNLPEGRESRSVWQAMLKDHTGKLAVISSDFSSSVDAAILPLWAFTMAAAIERPRP